MFEETNYENYKVYGVSFDGITSEGTRLYDAKGLRLIASCNHMERIDDFYSIKDSPFHTRKCIREYDADTKVAIYTYEDTDPEKYNELKKNRIGARMIAFPKFYYNRPDEWTFLVSSEKVPGFEISPMHCKRESIGGTLVEYEHVCVSEFMYNTNTTISQPGYPPLTDFPMSTFRQLAWYHGMYIEDLSTRMMVNMLAIIKYANLDIQSVIGNGRVYGTDIQYDDILGHDGYRTSNTDNTSIKVMDLVDWYGNAWEFIEGCCVFGSKVYINNDTKTIKKYPTTNYYKRLGWISTDIALPSSRSETDFANITYNTDYKYIMAPQKVNGRSNPFGEKLRNSDSADGCLLVFGGYDWAGAPDGLFCWNSNNRLSIHHPFFGARFIAFD